MKKIMPFAIAFIVIFISATAFAESDSEIWSARHYVDEFNLPTDKGYVTNNEFFIGTFSNSATSDSLLKAELLLDDNVAFQLYEYGSQIVKGYHSKGDIYAINVLSPSGNKYEMRGTLKKGSDRIFLSESYVSTFFDILTENGEVRISIKEKDGTSSYFFVIPDSSGLDEAYLELFDSLPHYQEGESEEIEVSIDVNLTYDTIYATSYSKEKKKFYVDITTNLPDGVPIIAKIYPALSSDFVIESGRVQDGKCNIIFSTGLEKAYMAVNLHLSFGTISDEQKELYGESYDRFTGEIANQMKKKDGYIIKFTL